MPIQIAAPLLLVLYAASAIPWLLIVRRRFGHLFAIPVTAGCALLLLLVVLVLSRFLPLNYTLVLIIASGVVGALGTVLAVRTPNVLRRPGRYAVSLWVPAFLGAIVWIVTVALGQVVPGMSRFGWAMNGDALNNLYFANLIVHDNGITVNATNPVPLPAALYAVGIGMGAPASGAASDVLAHDLSAFTLVWVLLLAVLCVAMGAVAASLVPRELTRAVAVVSALGSLLPLTWFVSGLTIQWGYFNVDLVVPIALGAWLIFLSSDRSPVAALVALIGFACLAFVAWTPIAILVMALGVALIIRRFSVFRAIRRRYLIGILLAFVPALIFVLRVIDFSTVLSTDGSLSASGTGFAGFVNLWWCVPLIALVSIATTLLVRSRTALPTTSGLVSILVGSALTTGLLVYLASGGPGELFSAYYPKKFAWILITFLGIITLSYLIGAFAGRVRMSFLASITVVALLGAALLPPGTWPETVQRQPIVRIAADFVRHDGEATVHEILALTTARHGTILWQSGDPDEPIVNEWLLLSHGGLGHGDAKLIAAIAVPYFLYRTSGHYSDSNARELCAILPRLHGVPTVITASAILADQLREHCPSIRVNITVTKSLIGPVPSKTGQNWQSDGIEGPFP